jgi:hypothetical protein
MKIIKYCSLAFVFFTGMLLVACEADSDKLTGDENVGGLLEIKALAVGYVVGNGMEKAYDNSITIFQGREKVTKIDLYKTFTTVKLGADGTILKDISGNDSIVPVTSNKTLFKTITVAATEQREVYPFSVNYNELNAGLVVNGNPVPVSDSALRIGDFFTVTYVSTLNNGKVHQNAIDTKIAVGTRFAGNYKVIQSVYWRIGVLSAANWVGQKRTIESVDATTYKFLQYAGPFVGDNNTHFFTISGPLDTVYTPSTYLGAIQLLNNQPTINCVENPGLMLNACPFAGPQNTVVRDDVNGKDIIYRTYGYNTGSGAMGPREFYEVLEKIVE